MVRLLLIGFVAAGTLSGAGAERTVLATNEWLTVHADGSVLAPIKRASFHELGDRESPVLLSFGLPRGRPARQWLENDRLPILHAVWEENGIRYTQTVLVTRLETGDLWREGPPPRDAVLMVRIAGENGNNVYAEARAQLGVACGEQTQKLHLHEGLAWLTEPRPPRLLAAVEVSASGVAGTNGPRLEFAGNMPPGITGDMVVKVPFHDIRAEREIDQLRELDFAEEVRRVKRFWERQNATSLLTNHVGPASRRVQGK